MNIPFIDLAAQYRSIQQEILASICEVLEKSAFIRGNFVKDFERDFANSIGIKHCIGVGNGTDALMISLKSMGIRPGDEVLVPANSFIATSEAITAVGAKVVFVDNHPETYNIDPERIVEKITKKTKVLIAVHLYGQMADMHPIIQIVNRYGLSILEDAAQAYLAEYRMPDGTWRKAGTLGEMGTFSFFPGKNLGAYGDAGCIVTNNDDLARIASMLSNHGRIAKYDHEFEGYNSRLDGIQAAVLSVKLKYIQQWTEKRREIASSYSDFLSAIHEIEIPKVPANQRPVWHLYVIRTKRRDELQEYLKKNGIETGIHYPIALPNLRAYKYLNHHPNDFPVATLFQDQVLSLPINPEISCNNINYIFNIFLNFFKKNKEFD